ncbi:MaoC/PaaZ C-terminal domain-containing protein [Janibacter limosus]|jgi:acyl dehydratase|uniref:Dehydratase n=1 Tax=Janibacter limosus TaxID=53458 RepID=A0A4V0ZB60_9MICO|nr:MaoC/PaaZ C-terminal domain-containing protein [Janibacter limosus]QBF46868.1 dehydratase [Janibacter limosus]
MTQEMPSPASWYFEDFAVGQVFRTQGRTITESDIVSFAGWSWDTNPVHTDAVSAAGGRFGEPIAHGVLGLSVAMGLLSRLGIFEACSIALLGIDGWRFEAPVVVGDTVRCTVTITGARATSKGDAGILERDLVLTNQDDVVVQRGSIGLMVARRQA